jgi:SAM-dependent methyltransferase
VFDMNCHRSPTGTSSRSRQDQVTSEWNSLAGEWDDLASGYASGFFKLLIQTVGKEQFKQQQPVVLDFGCGTGLLTSKLQRFASKIIAIDAAPNMIELLNEKIRDMDWPNVETYTVIVARLDDEPDSTARHRIEELYGKVDIIVASSVMSFIPEEDLQATMNVLGRLLKSGTGLFFHTDWPLSETRTSGITIEKALDLYGMGGMQQESTNICHLETSECQEVFVGFARKI